MVTYQIVNGHALYTVKVLALHSVHRFANIASDSKARQV